MSLNSKVRAFTLLECLVALLVIAVQFKFIKV